MGFNTKAAAHYQKFLENKSRLLRGLFTAALEICLLVPTEMEVETAHFQDSPSAG